MIHLDQRLTLWAYDSVDEDGGIQNLHPFATVWGHLTYIGLKDRDFGNALPHYHVLLRKNPRLLPRLDYVVRLHWNCRVLHVLHLFSQPQTASPHIFGTVYEKRCEG